MSNNERELVTRSQAGDMEAFCEIARHYSQRIHLLALHYCRNGQDAEDLSQDVWLKAFKSLSTFRFDSSFYTWLRRITINTFLNHQRSLMGRAQAILFASDSNVEDEVAYFSSEESIHNRLLFATVVNALTELTPSQRLMFLLRHYEGMSYEEIANEMNCSVGTVKKAVWRAIGKLKTKLEPGTEDKEDGLAHLVTEH